MEKNASKSEHIKYKFHVKYFIGRYRQLEIIEYDNFINRKP